jgi:hypothetical protein
MAGGELNLLNPMIGDHHGRTAGRATPLVRATDEIFGTQRWPWLGCPSVQTLNVSWLRAAERSLAAAYG